MPALAPMGRRTALLVIDVQNDFLPGGSLVVPHGDEVVPLINELVARPDWALVVYTQDWHPANHSSFAANFEGGAASFTEVALPNGDTQILWPTHCVQGSAGAELAAGLTRVPGAPIVRKGTVATTDSYSGFGDAAGGAIERTELESALRSAHIDAVVVVGLALDYCVAYTCVDAARLGFGVTCLASACRGIAAKSVASALAAMRAVGVGIVEE